MDAYENVVISCHRQANLADVEIVRGSVIALNNGLRRLREIAAGVDPTLQLRRVHTESERHHGARMGMLSGSMLIVVVTGSVLLLSAAGIYAMMSFTVARGRREIGIRTALGADRRRLLTGIFARASAQLGAGVLCGLLLAAAADWAAGGGPPAGMGILLVPGVGVFVMAVGLLATLGPARRGLAIQPTEALREE
jgi:ABC-type antimicrobial peptide transport system permease subunit